MDLAAFDNGGNLVHNKMGNPGVSLTSEREFTTYQQASRYASARPRAELLAILLWEAAWCLFCEWTPRPFNGWRLMWLRLFGAKIFGTAFVHQRARIAVPWNLILRDRSCLADRANAYSLGRIELKERSVVAQEAYLCTGTHKFDEPNLPLQTAPIIVGADAFIGARAFLLPGTTVGDGTVVGACSVVTGDLPDWTFCAGNPCRTLRERKMSADPATAS